MRLSGTIPNASDEDSAPATISDTENWIDWNGDLGNQNVSEDDWEADNESDIELDRGIEDLDSPVQQNVCAAPNVPRLVPPTQRSLRMAESGNVMVSAMKTCRYKGNKKM